MILAKELRIGNSVAGAVGKVYKVDVNLLMCAAANPDWVDPIPLTPEILTSAGFDKINNQDIWNVYEKGKYRIEDLALKNNYSFRLKVNPNESCYLSDVKYLHQLQNIYYSLTGEELNIEL